MKGNEQLLLGHEKQQRHRHFGACLKLKRKLPFFKRKFGRLYSHSLVHLYADSAASPRLTRVFALDFYLFFPIYAFVLFGLF